MPIQNDLFAVTHEHAALRRDDGIERAGDHADREHLEWRERAATLLEAYADKQVRGKPFLIEDATQFAYDAGLPVPPDGRAWGAAVRLAKSKGFIVACGYRAAKSSNLSPKVLWRLRTL